MKSLIRLILGVVCLVVSVTFIFNIISSKIDSIEVPKSENELTASPQILSSQTDNKVNAYIVKTYNNNIAVFEEGREEPYRIFDTDTRILPKTDQERLDKGIRVTNYSDLKRLLEDYTS